MQTSYVSIADPLRTEKRLANRYIAGLLLIVLLAAGSNLVMDRLLRAEERSAEVIELASRQQMLSQRIIQLAYRYVLAETSQEAKYLRSSLSLAVREMRQSHQVLLTQAPSRLYAKVADPIYFDPPYRLDFRIRSFLGAAEGLLASDSADLETDNPYLKQIRERQGNLLLQGLGLAVSRYVEQSSEAIRHLRWTLWGLFGALLLTVIVLGVVIFRPAFARLMARTLELHREAETDALTGSQNRRGFLYWAEALHAHVRRYGDSCMLLVLDIDHFKALNDTYGHEAGDRVLSAMVGTCGRNLRQMDVLGRLGGEEFAVLLPGVAPKGGMSVAEKLRRLVETLQVDTGAEVLLSCTISVGVTQLRTEDDSPAAALARADAALYRAKSEGRNQVILAEEGGDTS